MSPIFDSLVKLLDHLYKLQWAKYKIALFYIIERPKTSRMKVKVVSQESPKLLDRMRAEIRVRHYQSKGLRLALIPANFNGSSTIDFMLR